MSTNANSRIIADLLVQSQGLGTTFTGLVTTKKGETRGRGAAKLLYGDDTVHAVIVAGFSYPRLVQRSLAALLATDLGTVLTAATVKGVMGYEGRGANAVARPLVLADLEAARDEMVASFEATLAGTNEATTDHVYEPLLVDGETVKGARVYKCVAGNPDHECKCRACTGDDSTPLPGTIYLQGLQIGSRVLAAAPNGPVPASQSAPKTVAKDLLRKGLPVGRYVSYALEPGTNFILAAGGAAALRADKDGVTLDASALSNAA